MSDCDCDDYSICPSCRPGAYEDAERLQGDGITCTGTTYCICALCREEQEVIVRYVEAHGEIVGDPADDPCTTSWWAYVIDPGGAGVMDGVFGDPEVARKVAELRGYEQVLIHGANAFGAWRWVELEWGRGYGAQRVLSARDEREMRAEFEIARGRRAV